MVRKQFKKIVTFFYFIFVLIDAKILIENEVYWSICETICLRLDNSHEDYVNCNCSPNECKFLFLKILNLYC